MRFSLTGRRRHGRAVMPELRAGWLFIASDDGANALLRSVRSRDSSRSGRLRIDQAGGRLENAVLQLLAFRSEVVELLRLLRSESPA